MADHEHLLLITLRKLVISSYLDFRSNNRVNSTVVDYYRRNESIRTKIDNFGASVSLKSRANWINAINAGDYKASREWLERMEPEYFTVSRIKKSTVVENQQIEIVIRRLPDYFKN